MIDHIILLELSVVTNTEEHFVSSSSRKVTHYGPLLSDLECTGLRVYLVTIEVGYLGHFLPSTVSILCRVCDLQKCAVRPIFKTQLNYQLHASTEYSMSTYQACGIYIKELITVF